MVTDNTIVTTTDYAGSYIYENSSLKFISHAEGYIEPDGAGGYEYVYQYKDHLGNIRLSYSDSDNNGLVDSSEIVEESNYYPFGLPHKGYNSQVTGTHYPYTYNGKENNQELGLNWLDYGWRNFDSALGRWMNLDPLAELMRKHSPYNYALNNPIYYIDIAGLSPHDTVGFTDYYDDGSGNVIYDPDVHGPDDVPAGATYIGPTYTDPTTGTFWNENGRPHTQTQNLDEVVVSGKSKGGDGVTTDGLRVWGVGGWGSDSTAGGGIVTGNDRGSGSVRIGGSDINPFYGMIWWIMSHWFPKDNDTPEPNESTMEQQPEEEPKQQHPHSYFSRVHKQYRAGIGWGVYFPQNYSEKADAIEDAKKLMKEDGKIDSIVIKPFYSRQARENEVRTGRDTTITRN